MFLTAVHTIFNANGLVVFDVEELPTHGGSLRVYAQRKETGVRETASRVAQLLDREAAAGMTGLRFYEGFQAKAEKVKNDFLEFLLAAKREGRRVAAYGAAAKGNTLLNFAGVRPDLLEFVVDRNPAKQGKFLPGSRIPIVGEDCLKVTKPKDIVILPWNLCEEVKNQLHYCTEWDGRFVTVVPYLQSTSTAN